MLKEIKENGSLQITLKSAKTKINEPKISSNTKRIYEKVRANYPEARILAFGSQTRGTAVQESDFDICVILKEFSPKDRFAISDIAWETGFDYDILISTIVISLEEFQQGLLSASPLVETIRSEGVTV